METKTTTQWMEEFNIIGGYDILDPDGWDRKNLAQSFQEEITLPEFRSRVSQSTCRMISKKEGDLQHIYVGDLQIATVKKA